MFYPGGAVLPGARGLPGRIGRQEIREGSVCMLVGFALLHDQTAAASDGSF